MLENIASQALELPEHISETLKGFILAAQTAFGEDLQSIVMFGSAAENRLRATSDVNLIVVLREFSQAKADPLREPLRIAHAVRKLSVMFILKDEIAQASEVFAVKFSDILRRRKVLYGSAPFNGLSVNRIATINRLKQTLLNMILRLRSSYVLSGLREEQISAIIAETAGPLRVCAATLLEIEQNTLVSPKDAMEKLVSSIDSDKWKETLAAITEVRQDHLLPPGVSAKTLFKVLDLAQHMLLRFDNLKP